MSLALRCARTLRPAGIQLRCASVIEIHRGTGDRSTGAVKAQVSKFDQNQQVYIDIRRYFQPEGESDFKPTKKGVSLSVEQFENLARGIPQIREMIKEEQ
eukprot:scpid82773/ scgid17954/ 